MSYIIQKQNIIVFSRRPGGWETTLQVLMILLSNLIAFLKWIMIMLAIFGAVMVIGLCMVIGTAVIGTACMVITAMVNDSDSSDGSHGEVMEINWNIGSCLTFIQKL